MYRRAVRTRRCVLRDRVTAERLEARRLLTAIASDERVTAAISTVGEVDNYTISVEVGEVLSAVVAETASQSFAPRVRILAPNGTELRNAAHANGLHLKTDPVVSAGTYTVEVSDDGSNHTGNYAITVVRSRGAQAPNDGEGGVIRSGERKTGTIALGDMDVFQMQVTQGDRVIVAFAETANASFFGAIEAYGPDGALVTSASDNNGTRATFIAAATGTYTFVTFDGYGYYAGNYAISAFKSTGTQYDDETDDDFASIRSSERKTGAIALGDMDVFQMTISQGDAVVIALAETANASFWGRIIAYGPDGAQVASAADNRGTRINFQAAATGTYTFLIHDDYGYYAAGYAVTAFKSTGTQYDDETDDDFAALRSSEREIGLMDLGDMDTFQMQITQGDSVVISLAEQVNASFWGRITAYGPDGASVATAADDRGTRIAFEAASTGTYTFLIYDDYGYYTATYGVAAFKSTGTQYDDLTDDDFASIRSGERKQGFINLGDLDVISFDVVQGDYVVVSLAETVSSSFWARIRAYGPDGAFITTAADDRGTRVSFQAAVTGTYTFLVYDDYGYYTAQYAVSAFKSTGTIHADPLDVDGGTLASGATALGSTNVGDLDIYRVNATAGQALTLRVSEIGNTSAAPAVALYDPSGEYIGFDDHASAAVFTHTPTQSGAYTFVVYDSYGYYADRYGVAVNTAAPTTDTLAPRALKADFAFNEPTHSISLQFTEAISGFTLADVSVVNTTTGIQVSSVNIALNAGNFSATLTFPGLLNGRLSEGNYTLTLNNASVQDLAGNNLNGSLTYAFHVLIGDVNRDKQVGFDDLLILAQNYGKRGRIFATGNVDYSADGLVGFDDLLQLAQRYGNSLVMASNQPGTAPRRSAIRDLLD